MGHELLEPADRIGVWLRGRLNGPLTVEVDMGGARLEHTLELEEFSTEWSAWTDGESWRIEALPEQARGSIRLRAHPLEAEADATAADFDQDTLEELRQLGYIQ